MKLQYTIKEITREETIEMVQKYHYSNMLPRINKHYVGFFLKDELVGVVTLGWGTRPKHTIQKLFPSLDTKDYYEIGRMCMTEEMQKNSESQMLSQLVKWIKANLPEVKVLFTWADGMLGKCGYVYQASNFIYAGFSMTDTYMIDGIKVHPRQIRGLLVQGTDDKRITVRPTLEQMRQYNIIHYQGKQYRYLLFLGSKVERKRLTKECTVDLTLPNPKENDLLWKVKNLTTGKWEKSSIPPYKADLDKEAKRELGSL